MTGVDLIQACTSRGGLLRLCWQGLGVGKQAPTRAILVVCDPVSCWAQNVILAKTCWFCCCDWLGAVASVCILILDLPNLARQKHAVCLLKRKHAREESLIVPGMSPDESKTEYERSGVCVFARGLQGTPGVLVPSCSCRQWWHLSRRKRLRRRGGACRTVRRFRSARWNVRRWSLVRGRSAACVGST